MQRWKKKAAEKWNMGATSRPGLTHAQKMKMEVLFYTDMHIIAYVHPYSLQAWKAFFQQSLLK